MQSGLCCAVRCDVYMYYTRYYQIDLIALSLMNNCQETTLECSWHKKIAAVIFFYVMLLVQHSSCQFPLCCVAMFGKTGCRQKAFSSLEPLSLSLFIILNLAALFPFFSLFFAISYELHHLLFQLSTKYQKSLYTFFSTTKEQYKKGKISLSKVTHYDIISLL